MCTVLLPPVVNPIAVAVTIISISYQYLFCAGACVDLPVFVNWLWQTCSLKAMLFYYYCLLHFNFHLAELCVTVLYVLSWNLLGFLFTHVQYIGHYNIQHFLCNENHLMHYLSSVYFVGQPLHVSGIFVAHHQEVYCVFNNWYMLAGQQTVN